MPEPQKFEPPRIDPDSRSPREPQPDSLTKRMAWHTRRGAGHLGDFRIAEHCATGSRFQGNFQRLRRRYPSATDRRDIAIEGGKPGRIEMIIREAEEGPSVDRSAIQDCAVGIGLPAKDRAHFFSGHGE